MRLLVVSHYFWPENFRINDLVAELVERGHTVTVLTGLPNYPEGRVFAEYQNEPGAYSYYRGAEIIRSSVIPRGSSRINLMLNYFSYALCASWKGLWRLRDRQFDAILVYQPSPVTVGVPAMVLKRAKSLPMALWVLDAWPETLEAMGVVRSPFLLRAIGRLVTSLYRQCAIVLVPSKSLVSKIGRRSGQPERVQYFPNWAEELFQREGVTPAPEVPLEPDSFTIMFAGNVGEAQDFPAILDAAELLRTDLRLRWVVVGDGSAAEWVRDEIRRRGLEHRFLMVGRFPVERMPSFYCHADALLVSLRDEPVFALTVPGKLQSYLVSGKPVIAMLNGEGADVIRRAGAGRACAASDASGLAGIVRELMDLPKSELLGMGQRGRALCSAEFDRTKLMDKLERWLKLIAGPMVESTR